MTLRPAGERVTVIAHISDTHLDGGERAVTRARRVMDHLRGQRLDAILVSGDLADHGAEDEYEQVKAVLTADVPVLLLPGNHDERSAYRKVLLEGDSGGTAPINRVHRIGGLIFALLDSSIPGRHDGLLAPETLAWLRGVLEQADAPVLVCLHHPPVPMHNPLVDTILLNDPEALAALVGEFPGVLAVLCGHVHAGAATTFAGRPLLTAPGVVSTTRLPWTTDAEFTWANVADRDDPPGIAYHVVDAAGRIMTHFRVVT
ncbi:MAG: phosphodiesterase [Hamadaea sp.]|nr:phosphodiesterase [Hamadaea sp.]